MNSTKNSNINIACIGWGSLIWRPEGLKIHDQWFQDGPILPIEFSRISKDNRVTLIIDKESKPVRTLWALMATNSIDEAIESLMTREGISNRQLIHSINRTGNSTNQIHNIVKNWLVEKNLDSAIWTGLSYSKKSKNKRPSIEEILNHLNVIDSSERRNAEEYIRNAPRQIDTKYRRQIEINLGWTPLS
jgi:hypothetical protein